MSSRTLESRNRVTHTERTRRGRNVAYEERRPLWNGATTIDAKAFGKRLRVARMLAEPPIDGVEDLVNRMNQLGYPVSERTIYAYERGEQTPPFDVGLALIVALDPERGIDFFKEAFDPELWRKFRMLTSDPTNAP